METKMDFCRRIMGPLAVSAVLCLNLANAAEDRVVATVNGDQISATDFDLSYKQNLLFVGPHTVTKEKVIQEMVNRQLGIQKARKAGLDKDAEVQKKIEDILYHAQVSKDLEPEFKKIKVTDAELKEYYKTHPEYHTAHILLRLPIDANPKEIESVQKEIFRIHGEIVKDASKFQELATKHSSTLR